MDPDPDPTPDSDSPPYPVFPLDPDSPPDSTHCFSDFQDAKKILFFIFFTYNLPAGTLFFSLKN